jgi:hypothetical protein
MNRLLLLCGALGALGCAAATSARRPDANAASAAVSAADREAVIAAVQALFDAMRTRDTMAIKATFAPNAQLVSIRSVPGAPPRVNVVPVSAFAASIGRATEELVERMWDPRVEVGGDMASLWAPYDFRRGSSFSHCGHDAVHLVRTADGWKIAGITYTAITTDCTSP